MLYLAIITTLLLPSRTVGKTTGQLCSGTSFKAADGNWYCTAVTAITYHNISQPGSYNRTTGIDPDTGLCAHETIPYSGRGSATPLFGQLSMHLRGPMNVSQIAVYRLANSAGAANQQAKTAIVLERDDQELEKRRMLLHEQGQTNNTHSRVDTDVHRANLLFQRTNASLPPSDDYDVVYPVSKSTNDHLPHDLQDSDQLPKPSTLIKMARRSRPTRRPLQYGQYPAKPAQVTAAAAGTWNQIATYTSTAPSQATGITFLANLGDPQKSGTFDYAFGNSLSYVSPDGKKVASTKTPFSGVLTTSEYEIAGFMDKECDQGCEAWRPNAESYYGWDGENKAFFIEFQMDHYDNVGSDQGMLSDAPAWWFLNAAIPRMLQYGNDRNNVPCSCWSTGCGEFDAFEVLGRGEMRAKSTIHRQGNIEGGDSNYFVRPVGSMLKFAVIFHKLNITARVLDNDFDFSQTLTEDTILNLIAYDPNSNSHSLYPIGTKS